MPWTRSTYGRILLLVLAAFVAMSGHAFATPCAGADPNDNNPDDQALYTCLQAGGVIDLVPGNPGYILTQTMQVIHPFTTIIGNGGLANFVARSDMVGRMLEAVNVSNVTLQNLWFDGNKSARVGTCDPPTGTGRNLLMMSDGFVIDNVGSVNAVCASSAEVQGTGIRVSNSFFAGNGYPQFSPTGFVADGLTVWSCVDGFIFSNEFQDNTDVDLIVGGSSRCAIYSNVITHSNTRGIAGINVGWFGGLNGDHTGSVYHDNQITSGFNLLSYGIVVSNRPWYSFTSSQQVQNAGSVYSNTVSGAAVNLAVDWITGGSISGNNLSSPQGSAWPCNNSANYTAGNIFGGSIDPGYTPYQYQPCG